MIILTFRSKYERLRPFRSKYECIFVGYASGAAAKGCPFRSKYDRLRHCGVLCLVFLEVLGFRVLKNSVCKSAHSDFS